MGDGLEPLDRGTPDTLGRAVGVGQFGEFGFQCLELGEQPVELGVRHDGRGFGVIRGVGAVEQLAQFTDAGGRV